MNRYPKSYIQHGSILVRDAPHPTPSHGRSRTQTGRAGGGHGLDPGEAISNGYTSTLNVGSYMYIYEYVYVYECVYIVCVYSIYIHIFPIAIIERLLDPVAWLMRTKSER